MRRFPAAALLALAVWLLPAVLHAQQPTLSIQDMSAIEGNSGTTDASFIINLSAMSSSTITVNYTTVDGSATVADADYQPRSGTLTIFAGQAFGTITVPIVGDLKPEQNETFTVVLSNPVNATIVRGTATGTILNDDGVTPTNTVTFTPSLTRTATQTFSATRTQSATPTRTPTATSTTVPTDTGTPTLTPSATPTQTNTGGLTSTPTSTSTPTFSSSPGLSATRTPTLSPTVTGTLPASTPTLTSTPTRTATPTISGTPPTPTNTRTPTPSSTPSPPTVTPSTTRSPTPLPSATPTPTGPTVTLVPRALVVPAEGGSRQPRPVPMRTPV